MTIWTGTRDQLVQEQPILGGRLDNFLTTLWDCEVIREQSVQRGGEGGWITTTPVNLKKKRNILNFLFGEKGKVNNNNFESKNRDRELGGWATNSSCPQNHPRKMSQKWLGLIQTTLNLRCFYMKDLVYREQYLYTWAQPTNQPEWTQFIWRKSIFFLGEKVKVNMPIFDLTKYSFVVRSRNLCHIYGKFLVPLHHKVWVEHSFEWWILLG